MSAQKTSIKASTQSHLDIKDIQNNLLFLKNGSCCLVLQTTAINFGLLSEKEQDATIFAYAGFLNSLTFPVQIIIHSRQKDISSYLSLIDQQLKIQKKEKIKIQLQNYRKFIEGIVQKNKILDKKFYIIISFDPIKKTSLKNLLEKATVDLYPKRDHLISQFQRLGLKTAQLNNQQLIEIFYNIYNPESPGQKLVSPHEYSVPLVQSSPVQQKPAPKIPAVLPPPSPPVQPPPQPKKPVITRPDLNAMMSNQKITSQPLEGQKLQNKINNIVKRVATNGPIIVSTQKPASQPPNKKIE